MNDREISKGRNSRFRTIAFFGLWVVIVWLTLGGNIINITLGLEISWITLFVGILIFILAFTPFAKSYYQQPITNIYFPISIFLGNTLLLILYAAFLISYASDPYVLSNQTNKAGLILSSGATILTALALIANLLVFIKSRNEENFV